jgi:hypothetical protein
MISTVTLDATAAPIHIARGVVDVPTAAIAIAAAAAAANGDIKLESLGGRLEAGLCHTIESCDM